MSKKNKRLLDCDMVKIMVLYFQCLHWFSSFQYHCKTSTCVRLSSLQRCLISKWFQETPSRLPCWRHTRRANNLRLSTSWTPTGKDQLGFCVSVYLKILILKWLNVIKMFTWIMPLWKRSEYGICYTSCYVLLVLIKGTVPFQGGFWLSLSCV